MMAISRLQLLLCIPLYWFWAGPLAAQSQTDAPADTARQVRVIRKICIVDTIVGDEARTQMLERFNGMGSDSLPPDRFLRITIDTTLTTDGPALRMFRQLEAEDIFREGDSLRLRMDTADVRIVTVTRRMWLANRLPDSVRTERRWFRIEPLPGDPSQPGLPPLPPSGTPLPPASPSVQGMPQSPTGLRILPNPAHDALRLSLERKLSDGPTDIRLRDLNGREVLAHRIPAGNGLAETDLNVDTLPRGAYLLEIRNASRNETRRVVFE